MTLQKNIFTITMILSLFFFIIFSLFHFLSIGWTYSSLEDWIAQAGMSLCTGLFTSGLISFWSYRRLQKNSYKILAQEFRRLFDIVDDYLCFLDHDDLYFDEYYSFRKAFLDTSLIVEREGIYPAKKEKNFLTNALNELYIVPKGMLYYSYKQIKKLEKEYNNADLSSNEQTKEIVKKLDEELLELHSHLYKLKRENLYNVYANTLFILAGEDPSTFLSIDDFESKYKTHFHE